ncbi:MAG: VWA domain-containing protein [Sandaracinaceae bacterium]
MTRWIAVGLLTLLAVGCDCAGPHMDDGPCAGDDPPASCGLECDAESLCADGFYCSDGVCTADCVPGGVGCADGTCLADGRCQRDDASVMDGSQPGDASTFDGSTRRDATTMDTGFVCADVTVSARRVTPNVILIVDQSGSMTADFGDSNRWDALRDSLMDRPDGLVASLADQVRFGLALYTAEAPGEDPVPGECPLISWVPPAIDNYAALAAVYGPAMPNDETPTGASIDDVLRRLTMTPDPSTDPTIFILATDGEPDTCEQPNPQNGQDDALAAAERANMAGIRTFIISVGEDISTEHLQDMANAGIGRTSGPDAEFWVAGDDDGLRTALTDIIGGELSCEVTLEGAIQNLDDACSGTVRLNGMDLPCDDPNGWRALDATRIELQGDACETLQSGPGVTLTASFPCDLILI